MMFLGFVAGGVIGFGIRHYADFLFDAFGDRGL